MRAAGLPPQLSPGSRPLHDTSEALPRGAGVKDLALSPLGLRLQLWHRFRPWSGNFHMSQVQPKIKTQTHQRDPPAPEQPKPRTGRGPCQAGLRHQRSSFPGDAGGRPLRSQPGGSLQNQTYSRRVLGARAPWYLPRELPTQDHRRRCPARLRAASFPGVKTGNQPRRPSADEWHTDGTQTTTGRHSAPERKALSGRKKAWRSLGRTRRRGQRRPRQGSTSRTRRPAGQGAAQGGRGFSGCQSGEGGREGPRAEHGGLRAVRTPQVTP